MEQGAEGAGPMAFAQVRCGVLVLAGLVLASCGSDLVARADKAEEDVAERVELAQRYGALEAPLPDAKPGSGQIAGKAVFCGQSAGSRAIRVEGVTIAESDLGRDPEVFGELWRRAGC